MHRSERDAEGENQCERPPVPGCREGIQVRRDRLADPSLDRDQELHAYIQPRGSAATATYPAVLAATTNARNTGKGSRRTPATMVSGSPMIGTHDSSRDQRP